MREEKKIVSWSLVILFLALTIVYSLAYMKKAELFTAPKTTSLSGSFIATSSGVQVVDMQNSLGKSGTGMSGTVPSTSRMTGTLTPSSGVNTLHTQTPLDDSKVLASTGSIRFLSGTSQFFGMLDIVDVLGVQPQYTLQDTKGNYFAYYGKTKLDAVRTVQQLGGDVYTMATESEILENQLFGDKVSFINMLVFKNKFVLMVIEIEEETRLLQVPADKYHHEKAYLKSLFIS